MPAAVDAIVHQIGDSGGTPLIVSDGDQILGVVHLSDVVKGGIRERFERFRAMGIRTVMITGDNPRTAAAIAREAGLDDFIAEATPEMKLARIREEQDRGHLLAMTGEGTNDAPALAQADVGVAMGTGTQAAREAGNMVDLDSNPTKLFQAFSRGREEAGAGVGLGLHIAREVARAHGGRIGVGVAEIGGARFWLEVPRGAQDTRGETVQQYEEV